MTTYEQEAEAVRAAAAAFPATFGLRAFRGEVFRINARESFYSEGEVQLVVDVLVTASSPRTTPARMGKPEGTWMNFGRNTPAHVRQEMVTL